jgi:hypothetical protein
VSVSDTRDVGLPQTKAASVFVGIATKLRSFFCVPTARFRSRGRYPCRSAKRPSGWCSAERHVAEHGAN